MFENLIVSEPEGAEFKNRRRYFMVSSLIVGVFFAAAVVFSIYAADIDLGTGNLELVEMIAPLAETEADPIPAQLPVRRSSAAAASNESVPTRQLNMARVDEPTHVPADVSVARNTAIARPRSDFIFGTRDTDPGNGISSGREKGTVDGTMGIDTVPRSSVSSGDVGKEAPPPEVVKTPARRPVVQTKGVVNGLATYLPKPIYSAAALAVRADGKVDVQVLIDEQGRVVSARALSGHILLRAAAEQAARNARFTPTKLSDVPVKVTGVIVYNFTR